MCYGAVCYPNSKKLLKLLNYAFFIHDECLFPDHHAFKSTEFAKEDLLITSSRHKGKA